MQRRLALLVMATSLVAGCDTRSPQQTQWPPAARQKTVENCESLVSLERHLSAISAPGSKPRILRTVVYDDRYRAALEVHDGGQPPRMAGRGWARFVVVLAPLHTPLDRDRLKSLVPEFRRPEDELALPPFATGGGRTVVKSITREFSLVDDESWAADQGTSLEFFGPERLIRSFAHSIILVDARVFSDGPWIVAGCDPGSYIDDIDFDRDIRRWLNPEFHQQVIVADLDPGR